LKSERKHLKVGGRWRKYQILAEKAKAILWTLRIGKILHLHMDKMDLRISEFAPKFEDLKQLARAPKCSLPGLKILQSPLVHSETMV
jgi:hypothetical protein